MAMGGLRPVVAVYSTFLSRAFDQANLDVGLHGCPVVFVLDRAGITGDDGPSHHGVLDLALTLSIPGMTVFAPSSAEEVEPMLRARSGAARASIDPVPQDGAAPRRRPTRSVTGSRPSRLRDGDGSVCLLGVGQAGGRLPGGGRGAGRSRGSTPRCGTSGWCRRPIRRCWPMRATPARGDGRGRRAPRRRRRVPGRRHGGPGRRRPACPVPVTPGPRASPGSTSRRAGPTTSWPAWASTAPASPTSVRRARRSRSADRTRRADRAARRTSDGQDVAAGVSRRGWRRSAGRSR